MIALVLGAVSYDPLVRIHIGPLAISPHGIFTAVGFVAGARLALPQLRRRGIPDDVTYSILTRAAIGAIIGARAFYVLNNFSRFESPLEWFRIWEGGISLLGGIFGAIVACLPLVRRHGIGFFRIMDGAVPGAALGIAVGRIGDLIIADHLGATTSLPFGFRCPDVVDVGRTVGSPCPPGEIVHLTAAYDLISATITLIVLLAYRRRRRNEGELTLLAAITYGVGRFGFDFLREDVRRLGLTGSQWVAVAVVTIAVAAFVHRRRQTTAEEDPTDSSADPTSASQDPDASADRTDASQLPDS